MYKSCLDTVGIYVNTLNENTCVLNHMLFLGAYKAPMKICLYFAYFYDCFKPDFYD